MTTPNAGGTGTAWDAIDKEKRRDRLLRRVSVTAWGVTIGLVILLGALVSTQVITLARGAMVGALPWMAVAGAAMPFVIVLGILSVLIATLSTVGVFLRLRTASLGEIQLRLAALEEMIAAQTRDRP
jgi:hypothetical protein